MVTSSEIELQSVAKDKPKAPVERVLSVQSEFTQDEIERQVNLAMAHDRFEARKIYEQSVPLIAFISVIAMALIVVVEAISFPLYCSQFIIFPLLPLVTLRASVCLLSNVHFSDTLIMCIYI